MLGSSFRPQRPAQPKRPPEPRRLSLLRSRRLTPECMDDPSLPAARHAAALAGLRRINRCSGVVPALWRQLAPLGAARVLDLGSGGGDVPVALARRAARRGLPLELHASDKSRFALETAGQRAQAAGVRLGLHALDVLADPLPRGYDVLMCSLFLHHLSTDEARDLLARMAASAGRLLLVSDLQRNALGLGLALVGTRLLSRSDVVHVDGPRSVRAAFTAEEVAELAQAAGVQRVRLSPVWPARWMLVGQPA